MENEEVKLEEKVEQKEELPEEEKAEEVKEEKAEESKEEKKEEPQGKKLPSDVVVIADLPESEKPLGTDVEERRLDLFNSYQKSRKLSNIIMGVVVLVVIGAMVLIMLNKDWSKIVGYSLAGTALVGMIIFSVLTKNRFPQKSREYIRYVTTRIDQFVYSNTEFKDVKVDLNEKYMIAEFNLDKAYNALVDIGSRNIIRGLYCDKGFSCGELALYTQKTEGKRTMKAVAFIGKYLDIQNTLHFEGRYILNIRNEEKPTDLPTAIEDLKELHNENGFVVYGPEGGEYNKDIPTKYISAIRKLTLNEHLLGVTIVVWAGHTGIYLSYDDPVVALPFDKPFEEAPQVLFKEHLLTVLEAQKIINK